MATEHPRITACVTARCLAVLATLVLSIAVLEVGLRATGRYRMGHTGSVLEPGGVSYKLRRNVTKRIHWSTTSFTIHTDDLGFRYQRTGPRRLDSRPYYAVLGSSEVFGNGLDYERTFVGVLADRLEGDGIDILNMAVAGHHLLEQVSVFQEFTAATTFLPRKVIVVLNPLFIGGYDDVHKDTIVKMGELFPKEGWLVPFAKLVAADHSAAYRFFRDSLRNVQRTYLPGEDVSLSFYLTRYSTEHPIRTGAKTEGFLKEMRRLEERIRGVGAVPVCVYAPTVGGFMLEKLKADGRLDGHLFDTRFFVDLVRTHCAAEGIQFVNLEPMLQERYDRSEKLTFDMDAHFNGPTSRAIGEYLYEALKPGAESSSQ